MASEAREVAGHPASAPISSWPTPQGQKHHAGRFESTGVLDRLADQPAYRTEVDQSRFRYNIRPRNVPRRAAATVDGVRGTGAEDDFRIPERRVAAPVSWDRLKPVPTFAIHFAEVRPYENLKNALTLRVAKQRAAHRIPERRLFYCDPAGLRAFSNRRAGWSFRRPKDCPYTPACRCHRC